jgi:uncharacterized protein YeaO (DUF488 family)
MYNIKIKRVYDEASEDDGYRILVDRLWPRGISKERINIDKWAKEITPSTALRKTFSHNEETMDIFKAGYYFELDNNEAAVEFVHLLKDRLKEGNVTLLYASKNPIYNHAVVLKNWIEEKII